MRLSLIHIFATATIFQYVPYIPAIRGTKYRHKFVLNFKDENVKRLLILALPIILDVYKRQSPYNIGEVFYPKEDSFIPCTAAAVIKMLEFYDLDLTGKNAVVLGRSNVIGKPVAMLLLAKNATVTVCHSRTQNLKEVCKNADILVSAIGKAHFVTKEFVKEGAIVVDVGTNYDENGKVTGDVHFDEVSEIASFINPVPGLSLIHI